MTTPHIAPLAMFGDHFDYQKDEQFPSRFRKQDYSSPKFVQQQKLKLSGVGSKFSQLLEAGLYSYDSNSQMNTSHNNSNTTRNDSEIKMMKSQSVNNVKNKQFVVFPKIQQSIRDQQQQERNHLFLQYQGTPHGNLMQDKTISNDAIKMIYSQPYIHYYNVKKIRKISPETKVNHVCKKSVNIPYQDGKYTMPGLPNSENRTKKLANISFTKMQWNITNYNMNFALSKKEQEIRDFLKTSKVKKLQLDTKDNYDFTQTMSQQGVRSTGNQQTEFNFFTTYSKSPKSDRNTPSVMASPTKQQQQTKESHY